MVQRNLAVHPKRKGLNKTSKNRILNMNLAGIKNQRRREIYQPLVQQKKGPKKKTSRQDLQSEKN